MSGGFNNFNYLATLADGERCVLRLRHDARSLRIEADLLETIAILAPDVPAPRMVWRGSEPLPGGFAAIATSFSDGQLLSEAEDQADLRAQRAMCEQVATVAARIHQLDLGATGLFAEDFKISPRLSNHADWALDYLSDCFGSPLFRRRVGLARVERLSACVRSHRSFFQPSRTQQLCHGDFNQKNLLVNRRPGGGIQLSAVLDWEFSLAGSGMIDVGNFLRFETEARAVDEAWFMAAYRGAGGVLDEAWRDQARFLDLLALCSFLNDVRERPRTFITAMGLIDQTIAHYAA